MMKFRYAIPAVALGIGLIALAQTAPELTPVAGEETEAMAQKADTVTSAQAAPSKPVKNGPPRLNLFSEDMKSFMDRGMLEYIERTLYDQMKKGNADDGRLIILKGSLADFKKIGPKTPVTINTYDANQMRVIWTLGGKEVMVAAPIGYDRVYEGSRSEIENRFIADVKAGEAGRRPFREIDRDELELYGDSLHILPGQYYQNKAVNRNLFIVPGEQLHPIWNKAYPQESIADLILFPSAAYGNVEVELKVSKHDYGKTETITVPLNNLIGVAESAGCVPYWGVEKFSDGKLQGALFLYNSTHGYDHVVRLEMVPADVIAGTGKIRGRASLFVPTNNVDNLFQPYKKKSKKDKINWRDNE